MIRELEFSDSDYVEMSKTLSIEIIDPNTEIYKLNDQADKFYMVVCGKVSLQERNKHI